MELHITTLFESNNITKINTFINICTQFKKTFEQNNPMNKHKLYSCKPIIIELQRGDNSIQPMCSINFLYSFELFKIIQNEFVNELIKNQMPLKRVKVEEKLFKNKEMKTNIIDHAKYFEYHALIEWKNTHFETFNIKNCQISKSNLSTRPENFRILTCRIQLHECNTKDCFFDKIETCYKPSFALLENFIRIIKEEYEYALFDDNELFDKNWLVE